MYRHFGSTLLIAAALSALALVPVVQSQGKSRNRDSLFVGDNKDDSVRRFDVPSGDSGGRFVTSGSGGLHGAAGVIFDHEGSFLVVNQNVDLPIAGEVLRYNGKTGEFLGALIPASSPNAPFAPRGIVLSPDNVLYVADTIAPDNIGAGRVARYDAGTGAFLGDLDATSLPALYAGEYHPL